MGRGRAQPSGSQHVPTGGAADSSLCLQPFFLRRQNAGILLPLPRHPIRASVSICASASASAALAVQANKVYCALAYPNSSSTELRCRLALRSTHPGANNRLDIESIVTYDRELGSTAAVDPQLQGAADSWDWERAIDRVAG